MTKPGFMLIELIVASLVASMVAALLLAALAQSNRFQTIDDNLIDLSTRIAVISNQLEKDVMGAFIPVQAEEKKEEPKKQEPSNDKAQQDASPDLKGVAQNVPAKEKPKPIEKIFYSTQKNGQLDILTFVTNNPLVVYVGADVGEVKPKVVRVQYSLKPEAEKKDSYALFRQESMELDLEKYKNVTSYEVIGGIKRCTMTFTARIEKKPSSESAISTPEKPAAPEKIQYEYKTQNEWVSEQKKSSSTEVPVDRENKDKSEFPRIPYSVEMKLILWDLQEKREKEFTVVCEIPTDFSPVKVKKEDKKAPDKPKQNDQKNESASDKDQVTQVAHNKVTATEKIRIFDQTGKMVYEAEKNANTIDEIHKRYGIRV